MIRSRFGRKPQGKFVIIMKVNSLLGISGRVFEKFIESRIIPLKKKYPHVDIYIEVNG